ncbi:M48 family metallopeptidase [Candidatus Woesearchaeota archaeon]|nr:M48 family metallopeptidase [Candidatus Woesearchaeota archaeon]
MNLLEAAYRRLYPESASQEFRLKYSGKFNGYNANIRQRGSTVQANLSKQWLEISTDIQIGLLQELLCRLRKDRQRTMEMDIYAAFLRNAHLVVPKTQTDAVLAASFNRVNEAEFNGLLDMTNLSWSDGLRTLGRYDYGTDTITLSNALAQDAELLDYIMFHEMLHKKHKFGSGNRRTYHSTEFRKQEKAYPNAKELEERLSRLAARKRRWFGLF